MIINFFDNPESMAYDITRRCVTSEGSKEYSYTPAWQQNAIQNARFWDLG